jgi:ribA/ribD-fused uncharacterized protein
MPGIPINENIPSPAEPDELLEVSPANSPEAAKPTPKPRREKIVLDPSFSNPKDEVVALNQFYARRAKKPTLYGYDGRGNLVIRNANGSIETTISLPKYRPLSVEELNELNETRRDKIAESEEAYEVAMEELRTTIREFAEGQRLASAVKDAQLAVEVADTVRLKAQFAAHTTKKIVDLTFNELFGAEEKYNKLKIDYPVIKSVVAEFEPKIYWTRAMTADEEADEDAAAEQKVEDDLERGDVEGAFQVDPGVKSPDATRRPVANVLILFNRPTDNEYGFLANDYSIRFNYKGVEYLTADHALAAEAARYFGDMIAVDRIMAKSSPQTARTEARKVLAAYKPQATASENMAPQTEAERAVKTQKLEAWNKIRPQTLMGVLLAKFRSSPAVQRLLLDSGDAELAYAEARDSEDGIGLAITDARAGIKEKWRGKNLLGETLMNVRTQLRGGAAGPTISEAQVAAAGAPVPVSVAERNAQIATGIMVKRRLAMPT